MLHKYPFLLRIITILLLIGPLLALTFPFYASQTTTIFLIDCSLSCKGQQEALKNYLNKQIGEKHKKDSYMVITFGKEPMVEAGLQKEKRTIGLQTTVDPHFTNIEEAIKLALKHFPKENNKRLVICTDGKENLGSIEAISFELDALEINTFLYKLDGPKGKDVQLQTLALPERIYHEGKLPLKLGIYANYKGTGLIRIKLDGQETYSQRMQFKAGESTCKLELPLKDMMKEEVVVTIESGEDTVPQNNRKTGKLYFQTPPKVLIVGEQSDTKNVENLFKSMALEVVCERARQVSTSLSTLLTYHQIVLVNTPYESLKEEWISHLKYCVEQEGTGLLVIGGKTSFGLGGYKDTPLEKMLPVTSQVEAPKNKANMGLILLVDASGSMADQTDMQDKMTLVKESMKASVELLEKEDYLGVLAFSDGISWVVPYRPCLNKQEIGKRINQLDAKGGTLIQPGLGEAINTLVASNTKLKHIILMTDGEGEKEGYETLVQKLSANHITLSTVAIGKKADTSFLKKLSEEGKGRTYISEYLTDMPKIFAEETYAATKKYLQEKNFVPEITTEGTEVFLKEKLPPLEGYIATTAKPDATVLLKSGEEEPILAKAYAGLGKVIVWTSDLSGNWSQSWLQWPKFTKAWQQIIQSSIRQNTIEEAEIAITSKQTNLDLSVASSKPLDQVALSLMSPSGKVERLIMPEVDEDVFEQKRLLEEVGEYACQFELQYADGKVGKTTRIIYQDYSPEYMYKSDTTDLLMVLKENKLLTGEEKVFKLPLEKRQKANIDIAPYLLLGGYVVFLIDLYQRKRRYDK